MNKLILIIICLLGVFSGCIKHTTPYDFDFPNEVIRLPNSLNEISGLDMINDTTIACIQDEKGIIFMLNPVTQKVRSKLKFDRSADYEGVAVYKQNFYVLQSNGDILIVNEDGIDQKVKFDGCKTSDFEGLCVDEINNRLLVACKHSCKKKDHNDILIYAVSLKKKKYAKKEVFRLKKKDIHKNFKSSGIAIHPNGNIYVLSSFSKTVLVLSPKGNRIEQFQLNSYIFHQPEGITFSPQGDLYISNEKNKTGATLMKLNN